MKRNHGKNTKSIWNTSKRDSTETPLNTIPKSLKIGKELGVPAQEEGRDPVEGTTAMIDRIVGETTAKKVGETTAMRGEEREVGETTALRGKVEETTARGIGRREVEAGVGETTPLMKAGGTLVKTGEGVARGPLVMEGPLLANP